MVEPSDAKDLIDEAIERAEAQEEKREAAERASERRFRNRVSILVGIFAAVLACIHVLGAANARIGVFDTIEASDTYAYMEAKIVRETVLKSAAASTAVAADERRQMLAEAKRLRKPDAAGHGIDQLRAKADVLRDAGQKGGERGERFELCETGIQIAIVLLSIALVAQSWRIVMGASLLAAIATIGAVITAFAG